MELQQQYTELLLKTGFPAEDISQLWLELEKAYSEKTRQYHKLNHLKEMIACFEQYRSKLRYPNEVLFAIFYHDYIYNSSKKDNELKSAEYAVKILKNNSTLDKKKIFDLIMATKDHRNTNSDDEKWLIDFDLKILAKDWDDYKTYFQQIRKEYNIYPDFLYNPGRKKALKHFLENEFIFQTEVFRTLYETKARENITREIKSL